MASIAKLLMDEFYSMKCISLDNDDFEKSMVFSASEGMVNNLMHGRSDAGTLSLCKNTFLEFSERDDRSVVECEAYKESALVVDIFAEQYGLELTDNETAQARG